MLFGNVRNVASKPWAWLREWGKLSVFISSGSLLYTGRDTEMYSPQSHGFSWRCGQYHNAVIQRLLTTNHRMTIWISRGHTGTTAPSGSTLSYQFEGWEILLWSNGKAKYKEGVCLHGNRTEKSTICTTACGVSDVNLCYQIQECHWTILLFVLSSHFTRFNSLSC